MFLFSGPKLRAKRTQLGRSREWLAVEVNRSASAIALYETGHRSPSRATLLRLASALGVSPAELVDRDPDFESVAP